MGRTKSPERERDLLAQLAASPGDLALRRVYADLLSEREDPRGEFITLQLLARQDRKQQARVRALERAHATSWLGPLAEIIEHPEYEGGFLAGAAMSPGTAAAWRAVTSPAIAHELAPLRRLALDPRILPGQAAPLLAGRLPLLETLSIGPELAGVVRCELAKLELGILSDTPELAPVRITFDPAPAELAFIVADYDLLATYAATLLERVYREGLPSDTKRFVVRSYNQLVLSRDDQGSLSRLSARCGTYGRPTLIATLADALDACPVRALATVEVDVELTLSERRRLGRALRRFPEAKLTSSSPPAAAPSRGRRSAGSK